MRITKADIERGLRELGLNTGDIVLLHSSVVSLGELEGDADTVIDAFLSVIGYSGTLLAPCFAALGIIPERLKQRPGALISPCPVGTVVALGPAAEALCREHWVPDSPHAENTPYGRLAEMGGYICLLGVDQDRNTFLHGIEARLKLPYLGDVSETFTTPDGKRLNKTWHYYPGPHRDFIGLDHLLAKAGILRRTRIGTAEVRVMPAAELLAFGLELGAEHPDFVLCDNPACADCTAQRAALFSARMAKESFELSASSQLAGKYVDEIIDNLSASGIDRVELDDLRGRPCMMLSGDELKDAIDRLSKKNIGISALRLPVLPDEPEVLLKKLGDCGIVRVIAPLSEAAKNAKFLAVAKGLGIECRFFNSRGTAMSVSENYNALGLSSPGFCFNPAEFAAAGENPFLTSYRIGRFIRKTAQLDITDGLWDGSPALPGRGNGEVKELLSIFRCRNFSGCMVLGGGMRGGTGFKLSAFVEAFSRLLDNI